VAHGEWTDFVETHCKMSLRSAQRYMKAAKDETIKLPFFDDIPDPFGNQKNVVAAVPKNDTLSLLPTATATEMVVVPKSDPPIATPKLESPPEHTALLESDVEYEDCDDDDDEVFNVNDALDRLNAAIRREIDQWPACHLSSAVDELKRIAGEVSR